VFLRSELKKAGDAKGRCYFYEITRVFRKYLDLLLSEYQCLEHNCLIRKRRQLATKVGGISIVLGA